MEPINTNQTKNRTNQLVPYSQHTNPMVALNEELVHGAMSWTMRLQCHFASQLGSEIINIQEIPPQLKKIFTVMETYLWQLDEETEERSLCEVRSMIQVVVDQKKKEAQQKLDYAGVRTYRQLIAKQELVKKYVEEAMEMYLGNPCNIAVLLQIDRLLIKTKFNTVSPEHEEIVTKFWSSVASNPKHYNEALTLEYRLLGFTMLDVVESALDQFKQKTDVHPILATMQLYHLSFTKLKEELVREKESCNNEVKISLYNYALLKAEVNFSSLIWEITHHTFNSKITRAEKALADFTEFFRNLSERNIALDRETIKWERENNGWLEPLLQAQQSLNGDLDDYLKETIIDENHSLSENYQQIKSVFMHLLNHQSIIHRYYKQWNKHERRTNKIEEELNDYIRKEQAKTHADFEAVALDTLQHEGILNPIEAKQILASQPTSDKKIFEALVIANPMYSKFRNQETVLLLEEMRFDVYKGDPVKNFVKLYEARDQKILSLLGGTKVTLADNN